MTALKLLTMKTKIKIKMIVNYLPGCVPPYPFK